MTDKINNTPELTLNVDSAIIKELFAISILKQGGSMTITSAELGERGDWVYVFASNMNDDKTEMKIEVAKLDRDGKRVE